MPVEIRIVRADCDLEEFLEVPYRVMKDDPAFVPPLRFERREFLSRKKNPFFRHGEAEYFLALRDCRVVGRISAHVNRLHDERYADGAGFFGLFDCEDDEEAATALLDAACRHLAAKGRKSVRGPFNFSINDDCGVLIEGFDTPPYIMMTHNPPYYDRLLAAAGFSRIKDLFAWSYDATRPVPELAAQIAEAVRQHPGLKIRTVDTSNLGRDVRILMEVFNEAWSRNWGFIPLADYEIEHAAAQMKMILEPELALIAEVDGEVAAISLALPNANELLAGLDGRLFPFGWLRLAWRMKFAKPKHARLVILGVRPKFRGSVLGGLSVLLYSEMHRRGTRIGIVGGECSWTLEDNVKINAGIEMMGGTVYKKYRIYERELP